MNKKNHCESRLAEFSDSEAPVESPSLPSKAVRRIPDEVEQEVKKASQILAKRSESPPKKLSKIHERDSVDSSRRRRTSNSDRRSRDKDKPNGKCPYYVT